MLLLSRATEASDHKLSPFERAFNVQTSYVVMHCFVHVGRDQRDLNGADDGREHRWRDHAGAYSSQRSAGPE